MNFFNKSILISISILFIISTIIIYFQGYYCKEIVPGKSEFGKSPVLDRNEVSTGYTLFSTLNGTNLAFDRGEVYLIDMFGKVVHVWKTNNRVLYSILEPNGNLMTAQLDSKNDNFPQAARITILQELSPEGKVLWEFNNEAMHHDFDVLPNGNVAFLGWQPVPDGMASEIKGGLPGTEFKSELVFSDSINEIDRDKNLIWKWNAYEHLDPEEYEIPASFTREQWTHSNSLRYVKSDPFLKQEAYLVSMRNIDTVFLISKQTGEIIWKSPKGIFGHQHDATLLDNGNILVFNNGFYTSVPKNFHNYGSSVVEINPKTDQIVWQFSGGSNPLDRSRLNSVILSGAQRLTNGNTFITLGTSGHLVEVTSDGKLVWDLINPYSDISDQPFRSNYIFKARRYTGDNVTWLNSFGNPLPTLPRYCW